MKKGRFVFFPIRYFEYPQKVTASGWDFGTGFYSPAFIELPAAGLSVPGHKVPFN